MSYILNYIIAGFLFQWFMQWSSSKFSPENVFTHWERAMLIIGWPIGVLLFLYSFIKTLFTK